MWVWFKKKENQQKTGFGSIFLIDFFRHLTYEPCGRVSQEHREKAGRGPKIGESLGVRRREVGSFVDAWRFISESLGGKVYPSQHPT